MVQQLILRNLLFTDFTNTSTWKQHIRKLYDTNCIQYIIAQLEQCPTTNKLHIQGYIELNKQTRFATVKKLLGNDIHIEKRLGTQQQAIQYCTKIDTQKESYIQYGKPNQQGKRSDLDTIAKQLKDNTSITTIANEHPSHYIMYSKGIEKLNSIYRQQEIEDELGFRFQSLLLYKWQEEIIDKLLTQNDRQILWVYDKDGNSGKSTLCKYIYIQHKAFYTSATKSQDITYQYQGEEIILFDFSRHNQEYINYGLIENFKNGLITSTKYETQNKLTLDPKILIFSNELPDLTKWTKDRYQIAELNNHTIVYRDSSYYQLNSYIKTTYKGYDPLDDY